MTGSILEKILSALKILSLEWLPQGQLMALGRPPAWAKDEFACLATPNQPFEAADISPFLDNFVIDAEEFWQEQSNEFLRSGFWSETLASGEEVSLEAVALYLEGRHIILIESSEESYSESFRWLQTARQERLHFISERKIAATKLISATFYDSLTGLPNQAFFASQLNQFFERQFPSSPEQPFQPDSHSSTQAASEQNSSGATFAVMILNLDRFQSLNDSLGRGAGDRLLVAFAERIRSCIGIDDIPVRFGGDEFGILLGDLDDIQAAMSTVQHITETLNQPFRLNSPEINGQDTYISTSVGVALCDPHYHKPRDLLRDAGIAMHQAKTLGRGRYVMFDRTMQARALELWSLESDLRRALKEGELEVFYQPLVSLHSHRVESFEALVRWQHPTKGWISPGEFIPMAEETGLILELDSWVLRQASAVIRGWQAIASYPITVNVNLSSRHFSETQLLDNVQHILKTNQTSPNNLKLEITESFLLGDTQAATQTLNQLRSLGIKISIDDFGTGYASLGYLQDLPVDNLKIDGYFIDTMTSNNSEIVSTIITLSHNLGINVTAERVETAEQYRQLKALGCDHIQGYLISKALPGKDAVAFINQTFNHFLQDPANPLTNPAPPQPPEPSPCR